MTSDEGEAIISSVFLYSNSNKTTGDPRNGSLVTNGATEKMLASVLRLNPTNNREVYRKMIERWESEAI